MKPLGILALAAAAALAVPRPSLAQATPPEDQSGFNISVGGGLTVPVSDFDDAARMGWHGLAGLGFTSANSTVGFRGDFFYGRNEVDGTSRDFELVGGLGNLIVNLGQPARVRPYVILGAGWIHTKVKDVTNGEGDITAAGGLGAKIPLGTDANLFLEGRYVNVFSDGPDLRFIPITLGVQFFTR
ncbi:MAG: porin family protein [Gemmatimonadetes bacterium]|nr:porin family protein [Gemmatimonadota bacterium]